MTVRELIAALSEIDPEWTVLVPESDRNSREEFMEVGGLLPMPSLREVAVLG